MRCLLETTLEKLLSRNDSIVSLKFFFLTIIVSCYDQIHVRVCTYIHTLLQQNRELPSQSPKLLIFMIVPE